MQKLFFGPDDFPGGEIDWNSMEADFDPVAEEYYRDLLLVSFPNACTLYLTWYEARGGQPPFFGIALSQHPEWEYTPFAESTCATPEELRPVVRSAATVAASRPSIRRRMWLEWNVGTQLFPLVDRLVLDPLSSPSEQLDALSGQLFVDFIPYEHALTIDWEPPHLFPGEFVIRLYRDPDDRQSLNDNDPPETYPRSSWELTETWRSADPAMIKQIVQPLYQRLVWGR